MRFQLRVLILMMLSTSFAFASGKSLQQHQILSFSDWKHEKVIGAKDQITDTKNKIQTMQNKAKGTKDPQMMAVSQQLNQHEFNLEVAEDLGFVDYVVLYLGGQNGSGSLKEAAAKMTPEETAQILEAYLKTVQAQQFDHNALKLPRHSNDKE